MSTEFLKLRRSLVWPVVLGLPWLPGLLNLLIFQAPERRTAEWADMLRNGPSTWFLLLMPLVMSLLVAQVTTLEHSSGGWRLLFSAPRPRSQAVWRKIGVLLALSLLMTALMLAGVAGGAWLLSGTLTGTPDWGTFLGRGLAGWGASLALLLITLVAALRFPSFLAPLGLGMAATVVTFVVINSEWGRWWPWALPTLTSVQPAQENLPLLAYGLGLSLLAALAALWEVGRRDA